jgi:hypothetical protein
LRHHLAGWATAAAALALAGCSGHTVPEAAASATAHPAPTASALPAPASGTGLRIVAGTPVRFGADSTPGVSGTFTLTCRGEGVVHLQPSKGKGTDMTCGGTLRLVTPPGGSTVTATTTGTTALSLDWTLSLTTS